MNGFFYRRFALVVLSLLTLSVRANNPGGFTTSVTTLVTTGTESASVGTVRYLDNGILHVQITSGGNVSSIKYLKPGSAGTPAANGVEQVSQFGVSTGGFGNHTQIYYYWYRGRPPTLAEEQLSKRLLALSAAEPRYGYRRIAALLRREGWCVGKRQIQRLRRAAGLRVPPTKRKVIRRGVSTGLPTTARRSLRSASKWSSPPSSASIATAASRAA